MTKFILIFWIQGFNVAGPTVVDGFYFKDGCEKAYQQILAAATAKAGSPADPVSWGACVHGYDAAGERK